MNISMLIALFTGFVVATVLCLVVRKTGKVHHINAHDGEPPAAPVSEDAADLWVYLGKQELELVFDTIPEEICVIDKEYRVVRANRSFARTAGHPVKDVAGKVCYHLFGRRDACCDDCPARKTFKSGAPVLRQQLSVLREDRVHHYEISTYPVAGGNDGVYHVIEIRRDITDEKRMFEYLVRSEKFASIGNMTAGIAHEMNNPLSGISGNASNLLRLPQKYGLNEKGVSRVTAILNLATRATAIMTDLLHLSRRPEQLCILTDINELLTKTVNSLPVWGTQDVERIFTLAESLPEINCEPSKIQQVIVHLTTNAVQAIRERRQRDKSSERGRIAFSTKMENGLVKIAVVDNGCGIAEEHQSKIFDPFFSTKPTGEGTGLGLSVSNKLIEEQGGRLFFESANGLTMFTIELPFGQNNICQP